MIRDDEDPWIEDEVAGDWLTGIIVRLLDGNCYRQKKSANPYRIRVRILLLVILQQHIITCLRQIDHWGECVVPGQPLDNSCAIMASMSSLEGINASQAELAYALCKLGARPEWVADSYP